ncbi:MAG: CARDB domain-containing protein [Myxococcota bacterium]
MKSRHFFVAIATALSALPASAQYVATAQPGVAYPALTTPSTIPLVAPGTNDPMDKGRATIPLGFSVPFYDRTYTTITVTANGVAFFEPSSAANATSDFSTNSLIPSGAEPNGVLAPFWDDLIGNNPTSAVRSQAVTGANGAGLAIEWQHWNRTFGSFDLTFQIRIWQNGIIEYFYGQLVGSGTTAITATVGIEAPNGTVGVNGLSSCTNNCAIASFDPTSTGTPVSYIRFGPPPGIDLQAQALAVDSISQSAGTLTVTTTLRVRNFGTVASGSFTYSLFLSQDVVFDTGDTPLSPSPRGPLSLGALVATTDTVTSTVPAPASGAWYVMAVVDHPSAITETNEFNNVAVSSVAFAGGVDLIAQGIEGQPVAGPGDPFTVTVRFTNQGFGTAGPVNVKLWASVDTAITVDDRLLHQTTISVAGGQQIDQPITFPLAASVPSNDYYLMLQLDDGPAQGAIVEGSEANNTVFSVARTQVRQADLVVTEVRVKDPAPPWDDASKAFFGEPIRLEALVTNIGGATAPNARVDFFLSDNETLNAVTDSFIGDTSGLTFAPNTSQWVTLTANVPVNAANGLPLAPQAYFFFAAAVAPGLVELNGVNNFLHAQPIVVRNPAPNLLPINVRAPLRMAAGETVPVTRTLANLGNRPSTAAKYRYYLSANEIITADDVPAMIDTPGGEVVEGTVTLAVGQQDTAVELVRLPPNAPTGQLYLGVVLDPGNLIDETEEDDNGLASLRAEVVPLALGLATPTLPDGLVDQSYEVQLVGQGAAPPFSFRAKDPAELPPGLTLSPQGLLSGTPTRTGIYGITFLVEADGQQAEARRTLRVSSTTASLAITTGQLPAPVRLFPYAATLGAAGGLAPYTWAVVEGALPQGLVLDARGKITGTVNLALGTRTDFTLQVSDTVGNVDRRAFSLTVVDAAPFGIQTFQVPPGVVGGDYVAQILAANPSGAPVSTPVKWAVIGGALPDGLSLEPSSGELLIISGVPTRAGSFRFRIEAVDAQGRADGVNYLLSVTTAASTLTAEIPEVVLPGDTVSIAFTATPAVAGARFFLRDGVLPPGLSLSEAGVVEGTVAADAVLATYAFTVGYGESRETLVGLRTVGLTVANELPAKKGGCSAVGGLELLGLGALLGLRRRRASLRAGDGGRAA